MKIINLKGGLGNQMFQYAYSRKLIEEGHSVIFDLSFYHNNKSGKDTIRCFGLNNLNIKQNLLFRVGTNTQPTFLDKIIRVFKNRILNIDSYYQSEKYFAKISEIIHREFKIKKPLSLAAQEISNEIKINSNPVSISIRRGDYVSNQKANKYYGNLGMEYYQKAIEKIRQEVQDPVFYFFSDDIDWVKANFKIDRAVFVSKPGIADYEELFLMSQCKHNIIANSTFSWWGAWLNQNPDKIVIAPYQWTTKKNVDQLDILPKEWLRI